MMVWPSPRLVGGGLGQTCQMFLAISAANAEC